MDLQSPRRYRLPALTTTCSINATHSGGHAGDSSHKMLSPRQVWRYVFLSAARHPYQATRFPSRHHCLRPHPIWRKSIDSVIDAGGDIEVTAHIQADRIGKLTTRKVSGEPMLPHTTSLPVSHRIGGRRFSQRLLRLLRRGFHRALGRALHRTL